MVEDIWQQPHEGYDSDSVGRTEEQIAEMEAIIGFRYPELFREHMKIQNGGFLWKNALIHEGQVNEFFYNGSAISPIIPTAGYKTLKDVLLESVDMDEIQEAIGLEFLDLDRLPVLSFMFGHTIVCFDYGYNVQSPYEVPEIAYFELEGVENGFEERLRIESYEELVRNLVYYGYESTQYYIGFRSAESIEEIANHLGNALGINPRPETENLYGAYNFEKWYFGELPIHAKLTLHLCLTPNQRLSNTHLFQNHRECTYILHIDPRNGVESYMDNSNVLKPMIEAQLGPFLARMDWEWVLIPYHKDNAEELQLLKGKE